MKRLSDLELILEQVVDEHRALYPEVTILIIPSCLSIFPSTTSKRQSLHTPNTQHPTLDTHHATLNTQHPTPNTQYSTLNTFPVTCVWPIMVETEGLGGGQSDCVTP